MVIASFVPGTIAVLRRRSLRAALGGVCCAALAVFLGGATIEVDTIRQTPFSLGLDWFVISWHHARHADFVDVNYAIHLPLVDMLMGTFKRPPAGVWPDEYGVMDAAGAQENLFRSRGGRLERPRTSA